MWAVTPTYAVLFGLLSWIGLCWVRIWSCQGPARRIHPAVRLFFRMIRTGFLAAYAYIGLHLFDIVFRILFSDVISYGSVRYIAAPVLLCAGVGAIYIARLAFVAPNWTHLLTFVVMACAYLIVTVSGSLDQLKSPLFVGLGLSVVLTLLDFRGSRPLWDLSRGFNRVLNNRTYVAILVLLSAELVCLFEGVSLLYWI